MALRAYAWILAYAGLAFFTLFRPIYGFILYALDYFQHPRHRWWGKSTVLEEPRWSLIASCIWLASCLLAGLNLFDPKVIGQRAVKFLIAFAVVAIIVTQWAIAPEESKRYLEDIIKLVVFVLLLTATIHTKGLFKVAILTMILGAFSWGLDVWINPHRVGGRLERVGGSDTQGDNAAACHLVATLPLVAVLFLRGKLWEKALAVISGGFIVNAIILCNSRGAIVSFLAGGLALVLLSPGKMRKHLIVLGVIGLGAFAMLMDETFINRQRSTLSYEEDGSAMGRLETWKGGLRLISDHVVGVGGGGFNRLSPQYLPDVVDAHGGADRAAHNTYIWVASDWGIQGLLCYVGFLLAMIASLHKLRRHPDPSIGSWAPAMEAALIGFMVNSVFINRLYAEVQYWYCGLACALVNLAREGAAVPAGEGGLTLPPVAAGPPVMPNDAGGDSVTGEPCRTS